MLSQQDLNELIIIETLRVSEFEVLEVIILFLYLNNLT